MVDVERGRYQALKTREYDDQDQEGTAILLPKEPEQCDQPSLWTKLLEPTYSVYHLFISFAIGGLICTVLQYTIFRICFTAIPNTISHAPRPDVFVLGSPWAGSTEVDSFPPTSPTNAFPSYFPTSVGYAGGTPTGAEPAVIITAPSYPVQTGAPNLVAPTSLAGGHAHGKHNSQLFKQWGNLSPWYSNKIGAFGLKSTAQPPETCRITGLHLLHRHGARYPTAWASYGGPARFATMLHNNTSEWKATGALEFLNQWTYKLGEELLTPFGRQQLYDLGVSTRIKYGFLLSNFTHSNTIPVFRTESQDRMLASAMNFALGFFGWPLEGKYQQSITIEAPGFNNTLAPYKTCPNAGVSSKAGRGDYYVKKWVSIYLESARRRLKPLIRGFQLGHEEVYMLQQLCAYETVALGYSKFCELFTEDEWEGFEYSLDLYFWYDSAFGSPVARVQGVGYVNELLARLTHTPIEIHNTSTNGTLDDNSITFPLNDALYVDATHEVVVLNILTALNLTNFAASGPLPAEYIPRHRSFIASQLAPFATNVQFQLLSCVSHPEPQIRIIINDGVTPLTGIKGCPKQKDGMCPVSAFVAAQRELARETDWEWACHGDWDVPEGPAWETTTGDPPKRR